MTELQKRCQELQKLADAGLFKEAIAGRVLQFNSGSHWRDCDVNDAPYFHAGNDYRIKPEPQYRPFTPEEAARSLLGKAIRRRDSCACSFVTSIAEAGVNTHLHAYVPFAVLATDFVTALEGRSGDPCGVLTD